jgi:hypothetical protein
MDDLTNRRFGRLLTLGRLDACTPDDALWQCRCDCGKEVVLHENRLMSTHQKSCGCVRPKASKRLQHDIMEMLLRENASTRQFVKHFGVSREAVINSLTLLHDQRKIHIRAWVSRCDAMWDIGDELDAPRPARDDITTRVRRHRARTASEQAIEACRSPLGIYSQLEQNK